MILLVGNYSLDRQQSMLRFASMMLDGLTAAGVPAELIQPRAVFGRLRLFGPFVAKWLAYVDKFILFRWSLRMKLKSAPALLHICDHSNAMYSFAAGPIPVVVTCHDLLAVRGALGDETDTPASSTGKLLQRWIVAGLRRATVVACDSAATGEDAQKLVTGGGERPELRVILLGLSYPYRRIEQGEARARLAQLRPFDPAAPFVLHVGANLRRKNREAILRIFAQCRERWDGQLVFVGERLSPSLLAQAEALGISDRIVQLGEQPNDKLEALYNCATVFLFPSRFEGFGWPIIEAQACGCPVICSSVEPMAEVAGQGALLRQPGDEAGFAEDLLRLTNPEEQTYWRARALENAARFTSARMLDEYLSLYRSIAPAC